MPKIKTAANDPHYHWFHCPGCDEHHAFATCPTCKGTHTSPPCPTCQNKHWSFNGDYEKPTVRNSILVTGGAAGGICHSFITDGQIKFENDTTNGHAGETLELPDVSIWPY